MTDPIVEKVARIIYSWRPKVILDPDAPASRRNPNRAATWDELTTQGAFGWEPSWAETCRSRAATIHALYRELEGWRGIESAPLQGWFDVWRDGVRFPDTRRYGGGGFGASTGAWKDGQPVVEKLDPPPTHWRRLPTPPDTTSGTEGGR